MTPFGLGDLAYCIFRPVVYLIDWVWDTDLKDCDRCKERRRLWNTWASVPWPLALTLFVTLAAGAIWWAAG